MNPKYVTSLELSKKLKELGVPQQSCFMWVNTEHRGLTFVLAEYQSFQDGYSAFLSDELMDILPFEYSSGKNGIGAYFCNNDNDFEEADTITNACAKMLIYLLEHKLITVEQIKKK
jgi:hypothetical protein